MPQIYYIIYYYNALHARGKVDICSWEINTQTLKLCL